MFRISALYPSNIRRWLQSAIVAILLVAILPNVVTSVLAQGGTPEATAFATAPSPELPVSMTDATGTEVIVSDVSRIVPLNGDIAEIVWALGLGDNVVGVDTSATFPPGETEPLPKIGYQRQLSAEGILSLQPTVIIGSEDAGPPEVIEQLRTASVPVVIVSGDDDTMQSPPPKIERVATALGVPDRGEEMASKTETEIEAARELAEEAEDSPRVLFLYVRGAGTQMIAGAETSADAMITAAGGVNAAAEAGLDGFQPLTAEAIAAAQPDVLLLLEAGLDSIGGIDGLLEIPGVAQTPAGEQRRVLAYDDLYLLAMGPRTGEALHDLVLGLHPELSRVDAATPVAAVAHWT